MSTPEKWHVREDAGQLEIVSRSPRTMRIALVCGDGDATKEERAEAELLAAAPELRDALCHSQICSTCAQAGWEDCDAGREALELLKRIGALP